MHNSSSFSRYIKRIDNVLTMELQGDILEEKGEDTYGRVFKCSNGTKGFYISGKD